METVLIDTFRVPHASKEPFLARVQQIQAFIKTLPGFREGFIYEPRGEEGSPQQIITIAVWESDGAFEQARQAVAGWDKQQGLDRQAILSQLGVEIQRAVYSRAAY